MKKSNLIESRLRSWQPRRPARRIEARLFGAPGGAPARRPWHWHHGWTGALTAAAFMFLAAWNAAHMGGIVWEPTVMAGMAVSNRSYAASLAAVQHNCFTAPIFGWTTDGEIPTSSGSFDLLNTNHSLR
jgi:hypothetical protein